MSENTSPRMCNMQLVLPECLLLVYAVAGRLRLQKF